MKYLAYGMNTNLEQMTLRCPKAVSLGAAVLPDFRFVFKQFATVVPDTGNFTLGVVWEITEDCEQALDRLEGYPTFYNKQLVTVFIDGVTHTVMTYLMYPEESLSLPSNSYYDMVAQGYIDHDISTDQLEDAVDRVYEEYLTESAF